MGKKGGNRKTKALYAPKTVNIKRKSAVWTVHTSPGTHKRNESVALGIVLRELAHVAKTMKEAKAILNAKQVTVNGVHRFDTKFSVGLFDVIAIEAQKLFFRVNIDKKGRLYLKALEKENTEKVTKVAHKRMTSKGVQITTSDGRVLFTKDANVDDSLKLKVPENKISEVLPLAKGALVFIIKGEHCAQTATVEEIVAGTVKRSKLVKLTGKDGSFETVPQNIIVIGKGKPAVEGIQ